MKHDQVPLLAKTNLDCIENLISSSLTELYIEHD